MMERQNEAIWWAMIYNINSVIYLLAEAPMELRGSDKLNGLFWDGPAIVSFSQSKAMRKKSPGINAVDGDLIIYFSFWSMML